MEENSLLISVIIPMYNSEETIIRALDSIKNQQLDCFFEVLIINDGSKDNCKILVESYIVDNSLNNFFLINQENGGVSKARNRGLSLAKGKYIAFLDADDYWLPDKIGRQIVYLENGFDFVSGLRNNEKITFPYKIKNGYADITLNKLLIKVVGQTSTAILKKSVIENTGFFDESQKYSEDANFWMRISEKNKMIILDETLVLTDNDYANKGLSANLIEMEKGVRKNIKEMFFLKRIGFIKFIFFNLFSTIKYFKRRFL